uniref:Putative secreted protein n=1 Tax=Anopheles triannulatus TaxID=58253 RepID=A0A2M4B5S1_9DIPT
MHRGSHELVLHAGGIAAAAAATWSLRCTVACSTVCFSVFYRSVYTAIKLISHKSFALIAQTGAVYGRITTIGAPVQFPCLGGAKKMCYASDSEPTSSGTATRRN